MNFRLTIFENGRTNTEFSTARSKIDFQKSGITPLVFKNWGLEIKAGLPGEKE